MTQRNRRIVAIGAALLALLAFVPDRRADIAISIQRPDDVAPQRVQAVVDVGLVAVSVLVTWSKHLTY
jgi:hypothetical protein